MERYTKRQDDGWAVMDCQRCKEKNINNQDVYCNALYCRNRLKDRLASYEDTGLEPQEIKDILELFHSYRHICRETPPERLRELVEADREGRCVVLPKVDDSSKQSFSDGLEDVFKEWSYEDKSAGLFGMSEGEKQIANALMAALKGVSDWRT